MHISGEIPFVKPQNDTKSTDKRLKTMKNEREKRILYFVLVEFLSPVTSVWKIKRSSKHSTSVYLLFKCHFVA